MKRKKRVKKKRKVRIKRPERLKSVEVRVEVGVVALQNQEEMIEETENRGAVHQGDMIEGDKAVPGSISVGEEGAVLIKVGEEAIEGKAETGEGVEMWGGEVEVDMDVGIKEEAGEESNNEDNIVQGREVIIRVGDIVV